VEARFAFLATSNGVEILVLKLRHGGLHGPSHGFTVRTNGSSGLTELMTASERIKA
jgi:hypothetical protein